MREEDSKAIENLMREMECPSDFACHRNGFADVHKSGTNPSTPFPPCMNGHHQGCRFAFSFGYSYRCKCPLHIYVSKNL